MATESACTKSEIDVFRPIDVQVALTDGVWQTYYPLNSISNSNVIEFMVPGTSNQVIDFPECSLYISGKFKKLDDSDLAADAPVFPANNLLHSMIRTVDISVNGQLLTRASKDYAYKDMFLKLAETDMPHGGRGDPQLIMEGFYMDDAGDPKAATNSAIAKRKALIAGSRTFELRGGLSVDLFQCDRNLIMGSDINIKIYLNDPVFYMMDNNPVAADRITPKLLLENVELYVRRVTVADTFVNAINQELTQRDAIYPFTRRETVTMTIPAGTTFFTKENLFRGQLGVRYFFGMVDADAYNGTIAKSPFYFNHNKLSEITLMENGQPMTQGRLKTDFVSGSKVVNAYRLFLETTGAIGDRALATPVTLDHFKSGTSLFCFTRSPDLCHGINHLPNQSGNLTLQMSFAAALTEAVMVICMAEFDSRIQINQHKNVITDYAV